MTEAGNNLSEKAKGFIDRAESLWRSIPSPISLSPTNELASNPHTLISKLGIGKLSPKTQTFYCEGLFRLLEAMITNFPENIFWDMDCLAASILHDSRRSLRPLHLAIAERFELAAELMVRFGRKSTISFRYVHDFTYGFDWTRWAKRTPTYANPAIPFNLSFLRYLQNRSYELVQLIEDNSHDYPKLEPGANRNPFTFSREPSDECELYTRLACDGMIPIACWNIDASGRMDADFPKIRKQTAAAIGIASNAQKASSP